jgi:hypothetical protein
MRQTFACGHTGKGTYCHTCATIAQQKEAQRADTAAKRLAKRQAAEMDPVDLSSVNHLRAVQRQARELLAAVNAGTHPYALKGKPLKSTAGKVLSVPVGLSYRLLFDAPTLKPLRLVSHEDYNAIAAGCIPA